MTFDILAMAHEVKEEAISIRRTLHKLAELSGREYKTAEFVASYLKDLGLLVQTGIADTGVTAFLDVGAKDTLLMRADMDALPIKEQNTHEYISETEGVMHACGHDAHMAVLLVTTKLLTNLKDKLSQNILFVFQPNEEDEGGAKPMIDSGILEKYRVKNAVGLHVFNDVPCGTVELKYGPLMASPDDFDLYIHGRGGHGAYPEICINPIQLSAKVVEAFETIVDGFSTPDINNVISVCAVNGGSFYNVIPDTVHMRGTVRTYDKTIRTLLPEAMEKAVSEITKEYGATYDFTYRFLYPPLINDDFEVSRLEKAAKRVLGENNVTFREKPSMTGEDFAYFAEKVPSVYFYLGSGNKERGLSEPLHSATFEIDENCLTYGISVLVSFALSER